MEPRPAPVEHDADAEAALDRRVVGLPACVTPRPVEGVGADAQALVQPVAGEWDAPFHRLAVDYLSGGSGPAPGLPLRAHVVPDAKLQGVQSQLLRRPVHEALQGEVALGRAQGPVRPGGGPVGVRQASLVPYVGAAVQVYWSLSQAAGDPQARGQVGARVDGGPGVDGRYGPVPLYSHPHPDMGGVTGAARHELLLPGVLQAHRPSRSSGEQRRQGRHAGLVLVAEPASQVRPHDPHPLRVHLQRLRQRGPVHVHSPAGLPDGQVVPVPSGSRRPWLQGSGRVDRDEVLPLHRQVRLPEPRVHVAPPQDQRLAAHQVAAGVDRRSALFQCILCIQHEGQLPVPDLEHPGGLPGRFRVLGGDCRHLVAHEPHPRVEDWQVDVDHALGASKGVTMACTRGRPQAEAVSTDRMLAWGWGLRSTAACSSPGRSRSAVYFASPVSLGSRSLRGTLLPATGVLTTVSPGRSSCGRWPWWSARHPCSTGRSHPACRPGSSRTPCSRPGRPWATAGPAPRPALRA